MVNSINTINKGEFSFQSENGLLFACLAKDVLKNEINTAMFSFQELYWLMECFKKFTVMELNIILWTWLHHSLKQEVSLEQTIYP